MNLYKVLIEIGRKFRGRRFNEFTQTMLIAETDRVLDVGGHHHTWEAFAHKENITILNIQLPEEMPPPYKWLEGNACTMDMFQDREFDIVFSNSVIEHVGDYTAQRKMANEIIRVGKRYWIQTPYKHFPIEPHFVFPFFQYCPASLKFIIAKYWPFSFPKSMNANAVAMAKEVRLLTKTEMKELFPHALLKEEKLFGLTKSVMAISSTSTF